MTIKNFSKQTFINATVIIGLVLIPSFLAAWSEDEGTLGTSILWTTLAKLFYILRFPTHTLLWPVFSNNGAIVFLAGLVINCMFYGLVIERLIALSKVQKS